MTARDEHRALCIEAMAEAATISIRRATEAFDSIHNIVRVVPVDVSWEMLRATSLYKWSNEQIAKMTSFHGLDKDFRDMSAAGDLTNAPALQRDIPPARTSEADHRTLLAGDSAENEKP